MKEDKKEKLRNLGRDIKKKETAITLIALVVTIIVLLILAAVTISLVLGENGILRRAREGRANYVVAANEEHVTIASGASQIDELTTGGTTPQGPDAPEEDEYAYNNPYIPINFSHVGTEGWNEGFTIRGNAGTANAGDEFVWVPCSTAETLPTGVVRFQKTLPATTANTDPNYYYNKNNLTLHPSGGTNANVDAENASVAAIRDSVGTYGGFYIAKYEAGCPLDASNNEIVPANSSTISDFTKKARSVSGANPWNYISRTNAITAASNMVTGSDVISALISGECWDTALSWITATADSAYATNSAGKGWYSDISLSAKHTTGYYGTNTNNIYDLGGNMKEWTTENCKSGSTRYAVGRGGTYFDSGSDNPAAGRYNSNSGATGTSSAYGFRVVLYK